MTWATGLFAAIAAVGFVQSVSAQNALEIARKAPPELFADAVIRLVERGDVPPAALEEAFQAARQATEPVKLIAMPQFASQRPGMREAALRAGLDALTLQDRIVTLMAKTDVDKAAQMFQSVEHPDLKRRSCADPMIADDSAYFDMAAVLLARGALLGQGALGKAAGGVSVLSVTGPGNSPGELASFAKLLATDKAMSADEFRLALGALGLKMQTAALDYRAFAMTAQELMAQLDAVAARARELDVPVDPIVEGARKLAVTQLSAPRCHEELRDATAFVDWFNHQLGKRAEAIRGEETIAAADLGSARGDSYFGHGEGKTLSENFQGLLQARGKPEWGEKLAAFQKEFAAWKPEGAGIDAFHQKMTVFHGLYQVIPEGADRDKLVAQAVEYLKTSPVERQFPAEWEFQVRSFAESALGGRTKLATAFRSSGDPGLGLYSLLN